MSSVSLEKALKGELISYDLARLIPDFGLVTIIGAIGAGKSALAYAILEYKHAIRPDIPVYVFGFPKDSEQSLPDWIDILDNEEFPEGSIVLIDEAYISFHSRESMKKSNKFIDLFAGLARQKDILAIFITQTFRKLDISIVTSSSLILIKPIVQSQVKTDRGAMKVFLTSAYKCFSEAKKKGVNVNRSVYVISNSIKDDFEGFIEYANGLPSFWSSDLSKAWKGVSLKEALLEK